MFKLTSRIAADNAGVLLGSAFLLAVLSEAEGIVPAPVVGFVGHTLVLLVTYFVLRVVLLHSEGASFDIRPYFADALQWRRVKPFLVSYAVFVGLSLAMFVALTLGFLGLRAALGLILPFSVPPSIQVLVLVAGFAVIWLLEIAALGTMLAASVAGGDTTLRAVVVRARINLWDTCVHLFNGPGVFFLGGGFVTVLLLAAIPSALSGVFVVDLIESTVASVFVLLLNLYIWVVVAVAYIETLAAGAVAE